MRQVHAMSPPGQACCPMTEVMFPPLLLSTAQPLVVLLWCGTEPPSFWAQIPRKHVCFPLLSVEPGEQIPPVQHQLFLSCWQPFPGHLVIRLCVPPVPSSSLGAGLAGLNINKAPAENIRVSKCRGCRWAGDGERLPWTRGSQPSQGPGTLLGVQRLASRAGLGAGTWEVATLFVGES